MFHVSSLLIHILLIFAVISLVMHFVGWTQGGLKLEPFAAYRQAKSRTLWVRLSLGVFGI